MRDLWIVCDPTPLIVIVARMEPTDENKDFRCLRFSRSAACCPGFNARRRDLNFDCELFDMADITLVVERSGRCFSKLPRRRHGFCLVFCVGMGGNLLCGGYYVGV